MAGKSPWSVKGISDDDRVVAKEAARKAGVPVGAWLSRQIRDAASGKAAPAPQPSRSNQPPRPAQAADGADGGDGETHRPLARRFAFGAGHWSSAADASERIAAQMAADATAPAMHRVMAGAPPAPSFAVTPMVPPGMKLVPIEPARDAARADADADALAALERRLEALQRKVDAVEARLSQRVDPLARRLDAMDEEIAELRRNAAAPGQVQAASGGPAFSTAPIERAVMRLSERLQRVEEVVAPADSGRGSFLARMFRRG